MIIRVPFEYNAVVIEKGKRNGVQKWFWEWLDVEVPETSDHAAPVALRWHDEVPQELPSYTARERWGKVPEDGVCETRWFDDSHWWPALAEDTARRSYPVRIDAAGLAAMCAAGEDWSNPLMLRFTPKTDGHPDGQPLVPADYRSFSASTREREIEQIKQNAEKLLIVDGMLWRRSAEPVCYLKEWYDAGHSMQLYIKMLPSDSPELKDACAAYRADRFEEAAQAAILDNGRGEVDSINESRRVQVLIPDSVCYKDEERALEHSIGRVLSWFDNRPIKEFSTAIGVEWLRLRDAYNARDEVESRFQDLEAALERFAGALPPDSDRQRDIHRALDRWRSRLIDLTTEAAGAFHP